MLKRFASIVLALIMVLGVLPVGAMAEDSALKPTRQRSDIDDVRMYDPETGDENLFSQSRGDFGDNYKANLTFTYSGSKETPAEILAELTANNMKDYFIPALTSPSPEYTVVESILRNGNTVEMSNVSINSINLPGGTFKLIEFMPLNFTDSNGNLCNAFDEYTVTWKTESGKTHTDAVRYKIVFFEEGPDEPERQPSNNSGEELHPEEVTIEVNSALDGVTYTYDPETGIVEFVIAENDPEDWKTAYVGEGATSAGIGGDVVIQAPDWAVGYTGINGNGIDFETFKNIVESEDHEFDAVRTNNPYYRNGIELAHITRNEKTGKVTISLKETDDEQTLFAWVDANGNISYQSVKITSVIDENTDKIFTFDDDFANIKTISEEDFNSRIEIDEITSNLMTEEDSEGNLNYKDGVLTLTYTGNGTDYESVKESFADELGENGLGILNATVYPPAAGYKPYKMEFSSGRYDPEENEQTLPIWAFIYDEGRISSNDEYHLYWISEDGTDFIIEKIGVSFKFPFKNVWMEKYWEALSYGEENSRLKFTVGTSHSTAVEYTLEELEKKGAVITYDEGYINVSFKEDHDLYVITNIIAQVDAPENAVYYKENSSSAPNILDYEFADRQKEIVENNDYQTIEENGKPRMDLSGFMVVEVNGLEAYISDISGTRVQVIDWYNENEEIIQRDYFYVVNEDFAVTKVTESVTESELEENGVVEAPTPLVKEGEASWKLTANHYPQNKINENTNAYYFQLEGDENTPEGDKVIYLPYSYIDEELTYEKAVDMKLKVEIYHYNEDHTELVEGEPLDGELTEYGIRFVVKSFSPFVLEWEEQKIMIEDLTEVPEDLEDKFDSVEEIKSALEEKVLSESGFDENKTEIEFMEIELQFKDENGNWVKVTEENFPEELEVIIPYPEGTNSENYKFSVAHLISSGNRIGEIDILEPEETEEGLKVKVNSLSPFAVAYEKDTFDWKDIFGILENSGHSGVVNGNKVTIIDGKEDDEKNPETGAPGFEISSAIAVLSTVAAICIGKKK